MERPTSIPAYSLPMANRRVLLARRPTGVPQPDDFAIGEAAVPEIAADGFLVRNIYLSVDPAQRGWASAEANYSQPVPLGSPMRALAVGVVVRSNDPGVAEGEFLYSGSAGRTMPLRTGAASSGARGRRCRSAPMRACWGSTG